MKAKILSLLVAVLSVSMGATAQNDLKEVVDLKRHWKFSPGDDSAWKDTYYDDSDWDEVYVTGSWEGQGYQDYNGYAWYRISFSMYDRSHEGPLFLVFGAIDDVDEVFLNGVKIGGRGTFPPQYETAYDVFRKYPIPAGLLRKDKKNVVAVRVYDATMDGGITGWQAGIYASKFDYLLEYNLAGNWKFKTGGSSTTTEEFKETPWKNIMVPASWENQGYEGYDGYGWYMKSFVYPEKHPTENVYLVLGQIDDYDKVYLNGKSIGTVHDLTEKQSNWNHRSEWQIFRAYKIPEGMLKSGEKNTIIVRVYDEQGEGGIYSGPIGIISKSGYERVRTELDPGSLNLFDYVLRKIFE